MRLRTTVAFFVLIAAGSLAGSQPQPQGGAQPPTPAKPSATKPAPAPAANDVLVTVSFTGKGAVDATHEILVFMFSDPNITENSRPLGPPQIVTKNGGVATFQGVTQSPVYIAAFYDEKSTYDGTTPPPTGMPYAFYGATAAKPAPAAIVPGPKGKVVMRIDGSKKWKM